MPRLVLTEEEAARVELARVRAEGLGLSKTWIAAQVGRTRQNVSEVLNATAWSPGTLDRIEALLNEVEAGAVGDVASPEVPV